MGIQTWSGAPNYLCGVCIDIECPIGNSQSRRGGPETSAVMGAVMGARNPVNGPDEHIDIDCEDIIYV